MLIHFIKSLVLNSKQIRRGWARAGHAQVTALISQAVGHQGQVGCPGAGAGAERRQPDGLQSLLIGTLRGGRGEKGKAQLMLRSEQGTISFSCQF